jgi:hypothetical protein
MTSANVDCLAQSGQSLRNIEGTRMASKRNGLPAYRLSNGSCLINGEWQDGDVRLSVFQKYTGDLICATI